MFVKRLKAKVSKTIIGILLTLMLVAGAGSVVLADEPPKTVDVVIVGVTPTPGDIGAIPCGWAWGD